MCDLVKTNQSGPVELVTFSYATEQFDKPRQIMPRVYDVINEFGGRFRLTVLNNLGEPGAQGVTYRIKMEDLQMKGMKQEFAMKVFKLEKSYGKVLTEATCQQKAARCGVAPRVYGVMKRKGNAPPRIIMGLGGQLAKDRIEIQGLKLTKVQQFKFLLASIKLDMCHVRHNDPNPPNFMFETKNSDQIQFIDFGYSKDVPLTDKRNHNVAAIGSFLHGAMQGLVTRGHITKEGSEILTKYADLAKEQKNGLTPAQIKEIEVGAAGR
jgi:tRNA A-37 threonylcarbamoyl transferase component Bud32